MLSYAARQYYLPINPSLHFLDMLRRLVAISDYDQGDSATSAL